MAPGVRRAHARRRSALLGTVETQESNVTRAMGAYLYPRTEMEGPHAIKSLVGRCASAIISGR